MADRFDIYETRANEIFKALGFSPEGKTSEELGEKIQPSSDPLVRSISKKNYKDYADKLSQMINKGTPEEKKVGKYYLAQALFMAKFLKRVDLVVAEKKERKQLPAEKGTKEKPLSCQQMTQAIPASQGNPTQDLKRYGYFGDFFEPLKQLDDRTRITGFNIFLRAEKDPIACQKFLAFFNPNEARQNWTYAFEGALTCFKTHKDVADCFPKASLSLSPTGK